MWWVLSASLLTGQYHSDDDDDDDDDEGMTDIGGYQELSYQVHTFNQSSVSVLTSLQPAGWTAIKYSS